MNDKNLEKQLAAVALPNERFTRFQKYIVVSSFGRCWRFKKNPLGNKLPHLRALIGAPAGQRKKYVQIRDDYGKLRYISNVIWLAWAAVDEIPPGCQIHHKNGDINDNQLCNLMCLKQSEHLALHKTLRSMKNDKQV